MVTPSYTRTAPRRGAVLLFVCRSTPSCRGAQRSKCPWGTTASPSRCARLLALHRRGGRLCPPPYMRIPCDFVGAMPISLRPCHYEPALTLARQSVPPAKKKSLSGFLRLSKKPVIASQSADWRGNPFLKRMIPALFRRFPAKRLRIPTPVTSVTGSE